MNPDGSFVTSCFIMPGDIPNGDNIANSLGEDPV